jgi:hypothetical protein
MYTSGSFQPCGILLNEIGIFSPPSTFACLAHFAKRLSRIWLPLSPVLISNAFADSMLRNSLSNIVGHWMTKTRIFVTASIMLSKLRLAYAATQFGIIAPPQLGGAALFLVGSLGTHLRGRKPAGRNIPSNIYLWPKRPFNVSAFMNAANADDHYFEIRRKPF